MSAGALGAASTAVTSVAMWLVLSGQFSQVQWGPASGWVFGAVTVLAVGVALSQADHARRESRRANRRLLYQIDVKRRSDQIDAVSDLWDRVGQIEVPTLYIADQIQRFLHGRINENQLFEQYREYADKLVTVEVAFTKALIVVNEPNVQEQVAATYCAFGNVRKTVTEVYTQVIHENTGDYPLIYRRQNELVKHREPMTRAAKTHLASPIEFVDE